MFYKSNKNPLLFSYVGNKNYTTYISGTCFPLKHICDLIFRFPLPLNKTFLKVRNTGLN